MTRQDLLDALTVERFTHLPSIRPGPSTRTPTAGCSTRN